MFKMALNLPITKEISYKEINKSPNALLSSLVRKYVGEAGVLCAPEQSASECCDAEVGE